MRRLARDPAPRRPAARRWPILALALALLALDAGCESDPKAAEPAPGYAGEPLIAALEDLERRGLRLVYSTRVVRPEMRVESEPEASTPREVLDELLAPHALEARAAPGGRLVVAPVEAAEAAEPSAADANGTLRGAVTDAGGGAFAGARIRLAGIDREATSGEDGGFEIDSLAPGTYGVEASAAGYVDAAGEAVVEAGEVTEIELQLRPAEATIDEIDVSSSYRLYREEPIAAIALGRGEIDRLPHLGDDLYRAVPLLPGTSGSDFSARFSVRGGYYGEVLVQLDGIELHEPFHLRDAQGFFTIIDPDNIAAVELIPGGFAAEFGDRMSGVLDMTTATPDGSHLRFGLSLFNLSAGGSAPFAGGKGRFTGSARRGYLRFEDETENETDVFDPIYWDAFGRVDYSPGRSSVSLGVLLADDRLRVEIDNPGEVSDLDADWGNATSWLTHGGVVNPALFVETRLSASRVDRDRDIVGTEGNQSGEIVDRRRFDIVGLEQDWTLEGHGAQLVKWGLEARRYDARYDYANALELTDVIADVRFLPPIGETRFISRFTGEHYAFYLADRFRWSLATAEIGARWDHQSLTGDHQLSPRLNLVLDFERLGALRFGWGHYHQSQRPHELDVQDGETTFADAERAEHWTAGWERQLGADHRLRLDAYSRRVSDPRPRYENLFDPFSSVPEAESDRVRIEPRSVRAEGVELFLSRRRGGRLDGWLSYALASIEDRLDGRDQPRSIDQRHSLTLSLSYRLSRKWSLSAVWTAHSGWPTTAVAGRLDAAGDLEVLIGPFYAENHSGYRRLDLRATRSRPLKGGELTFYVDVQNALDRDNIRGFEIRDDSFIIDPSGEVLFQPGVEEWIGFVPTFGVGWSR